MPPSLQEASRRRLALVLLVIKLIPLFRVVFFRCDVLSLLYLYWAENVAVGLVNLLATRKKMMEILGFFLQAGEKFSRSGG